MEYVVKISFGEPSDVAQWNALALQNGNLIQHTSTATLDSFFNNQSVYIEILLGQLLVGAYRFNYFESKRLPSFIRSISRSATFLGEALYHSEHPVEKLEPVLSEAISTFLKEKKVVRIKFSSYYGQGMLPSLFRQANSKHFHMAIIDLSKSEEALWEAVHSKHRNSIRKAEKSGVTVNSSEDIDTFIALMRNTYEGQEGKRAPNYDYIKAQYLLYAKSGHAILFLAYQEGKAYNGAMVTLLGNTAYYAFAGTIKNPWAAGNLNQWYILKDLKARGLTRYSLGQVAIEGTTDFGDEKFISGITTFKMRFGPHLEEGISTQQVLRPIADFCWTILLKVFR